ncbi:PKD domain-containing protein [candidate division WOR-3 bacterium]|nr:PKD domain-containing protein [candidate division WOR-3 bacterium]
MKRILVLVGMVPWLLDCANFSGGTPQADFTAEPLAGNAPLKVDFTDRSSGDPEGWKWNFGDGTSSVLQNPTHVYNTAGTYDVILAVSNELGVDSVIREDYIVVTSDSLALGANFTAEPTSGPPHLEVQFTDHSTGNPSSWFWDFGDDSTSTQENPVHVYYEAGAYDVTLVVSREEASDTLKRKDYIVVEQDEYQEITKEEITLKWKTYGDNLYVVLSAPTTGWVSVGLDPSADNHKDANIIIGYVKEGVPYIQDNYGTSQYLHEADVELGGTDDVQSWMGTEIEGVTEISFSIPLDSGDPYDKPLLPGETYKVILAHGPNGADDFTSKHVRVAIVSIKIS